MKKTVIIVLALFMIFNVTGCIKKIDNNEGVNLYPAFKMDGKSKLWGYIKDSGEFVIEPKYDAAFDFSEEGLAQIHRYNAVGLVNDKGQEILQPKYKEIFNHKNGYIVAHDGRIFHVFNYEGKEQFVSNEYMYIGPYSEGLFAVGNLNDNGKLIIGYADKLGKIVIEPKFTRAYDFVEKKTVVMVNEKMHHIIDLEGNLIKELEYNMVVPSEDRQTYLVGNDDDLFGYLNDEGDILIEPRFNDAQLFEDGNAIVGMKNEDSILYGVINLEGKYIIEPKYVSITSLGKGYFGVSEKENEVGYKYGIAKENGEVITDFIYYSLGKIEKDTITAYDGIETYIVDLKGNKVNKLPTLKGKSELKFDGRIVKAETLNRLSYYNAKGKLVWEESNDYFLREGAKVLEKQYSSGDKMNIFYPVVEGLIDNTVEQNINKELYKRFVEDVEESIDKDSNKKYNYYNTTYSASKMNDLLTIQKISEFYIEGELIKKDVGEVFNISLRNGKFFKLNDLFREDANYVEVLSSKVREVVGIKIMEGISEYKVVDFKEIEENQDFIPYMDKIEIVLNPSQIISNIETFPKFEISHGSIQSILDMELDFWWTLTNNRGF